MEVFDANTLMVYFKRGVQPKRGVQDKKCGAQNNIFSLFYFIYLFIITDKGPEGH